MSVSVVAIAGEQSTQPFQCLICRSRFTRHENLKRHAALHTRSPDKASYSCELCAATFSRRDLCTRHMRRKHPDHAETRSPKRFRPNSAPSPAWSGRKESQGAASVLGSSTAARQSPPSLEPWDIETHPDVGGSSWPPGRADGQRSRHGGRRHGSPDSPDSSTDTTGGHTNADEAAMHTEVGHAERCPATASTDLSPFTRGLTSLDLGVPPALSDLDFGPLELHVPAAATSWETSFPDADAALSQTLPEGLSPRDRHYLQDKCCLSASQLERGLQLYFTSVSHFVPFLHRPTFDANEHASYLVLSMLCLGYQHGEDPDCGQEANSGQSLSLRCFHRARVLLASEEAKEDDVRDGMAMVQAYLLLEICSVMYLCGSDSAYGLKMHPRMISLTRSSGLTQPIRSQPDAAKDLQALWANFRRAEAQKRTVLAAHQIDALWYQLLSIPRSLSHLEIKLELPCSPDCWAAPSAEAWAYLQLTSPGYARPPVQYSDAIRHFLSPEPEADPLPPFDPFGATNITQFLLSSAREVSGWSTMTGRLSLERLEPLRASLVALAPYVRGSSSSSSSSDGGSLHQDGTQSATTTTTTTATVSAADATAQQEATWEIAMIELQIWSPSHTGGIIEGSVDAVLREATRLAATGQASFGTQHLAGAQPHIDWFLRYLDAAGPAQAEAEAPWTALYAYKAFLLAWQLLRNRQAPDAMRAVGVADGAPAAALAWARRVFRRRRRRRVGEMILGCLDTLYE